VVAVVLAIQAAAQAHCGRDGLRQWPLIMPQQQQVCSLRLLLAPVREVGAECCCRCYSSSPFLPPSYTIVLTLSLALPPQMAVGPICSWRRPAGLFSALLAAVPDLRAALLRPFEPVLAQQQPDWALRCMALLEAGIRCVWQQ
jgi:hypothetical protein